MKHFNLNFYIRQILERNQDEIRNIQNIESGKELIKSIFDDSHKRLSEKTVGNVINLVIHFILYEKYDPKDLMNHLLRNSNYKLFTETESKDGFDRKFGTKTAFIKEQFDLEEFISIDRFQNSLRYYPTPIKAMYFALDSLNELDVDYNKYTFIDVGSGTGRNLLIASEYPFAKIVGVEISKYLQRIAEENIKIYKSSTQKCKSIKSYCMNIVDFDIPNDEYLIFYFWVPFSEDVFKSLFLKISEFIYQKNKKIFLIFFENVYSMIKESVTFKLRDISLTQEDIINKFGEGLFFYSN